MEIKVWCPRMTFRRPISPRDRMPEQRQQPEGASRQSHRRSKSMYPIMTRTSVPAGLALLGIDGRRIFYRSDHYNFARMGIPIAFFTLGLHPDYHRPTDTVEKIDYKEMQVVSKTVAAIAWTLGNQEGVRS